MALQLLLSQAADLDRPPTQLEVELKLLTPRKLGRCMSSSSRGREWSLATLQSKLHFFQDSVKGKLADMKAMFIELLQEVCKQRLVATPPASSKVVTTGLEEGLMQKEEPIEEEAPIVIPCGLKPEEICLAFRSVLGR